jgi:putative membrane protein
MTRVNDNSPSPEKSPGPAADQAPTFGPTPLTPGSVVLNLLRGGLIGSAELVPGISGGTVALVTGAYERVLYNANRLLDAVKAFATDRAEGVRRFKAVDWTMLLPMAVGMVAMVFALAGILGSFVEDHPVPAKSLFLGMVAVSVVVPPLMIDARDLKRRLPVAVPLFIVGGLFTFIATGFSSTTNSDPNLFLVFIAAAVAVCALILPGVSGSFFLYAIGIYAATLTAVSDLDVTYILVFGLGALTGLVLFVRVMEHLLTRHRTLTLFTMTGMLLGSLRALWPWQDDDAALQAPGDQAALALGLFVLGAAVVAAMVVTEQVTKRHRERAQADRPKGSGGRLP